MAQTYHHADFPSTPVLEAKARTGRTVSVCIPARDEGSTVGSVVRAVVQPFLAASGGNGLVDEVIVLNDGSLDDTAEQARDAGAMVVAGPGGLPLAHHPERLRDGPDDVAATCACGRP